jgi:hypothetical protein
VTLLVAAFQVMKLAKKIIMQQQLLPLLLLLVKNGLSRFSLE